MELSDIAKWLLRNNIDILNIYFLKVMLQKQCFYFSYLHESMHNPKIRIHDKTNAFSFALQGNYENRRIVYNFLYQNFAEIRNTYGGAARLTIAINSVAAFLTDFTDLQEVMMF